MKSLTRCFACSALSFATSSLALASTPDAIVGENVVFAESDGVVAVEAVHFFKQTHSDKRAWQITTAISTPIVTPDGDPPHVAGASGGAYVEALPDSRRTHADRLTNGENVSNDPGLMGVLHYKVHFLSPVRYYVYARCYSTGSEDSGLHVGIDGEWPESGRRMQWTNRNRWFWDSKQRTEMVHTGVPGQLYLDVDSPGEHAIVFSMREDGFEFDKWLMTLNRDMPRPMGHGPQPQVKPGQHPPTLPLVAAATADKLVAAQENAGRTSEAASRRASGAVAISGDKQQWHKITLTMDGPFANELDTNPNPFLDQRMTVTFRHRSGKSEYVVPGHFAADGNSANTSATSGNKWRAHFSPDRPGNWTYKVSFVSGKNAAINADAEAEPVVLCDGLEGTFDVAASDKSYPDFRARGRLQYVGKPYLRFAGSKDFFLKAGADAPETLLAYTDFDNTSARKKNVPLKTWSAHVQDWEDGDPTWKSGKGKGLIGALNYLASKGCNVVSFMPYNAGGDGDNVWPFVERNDKLHYDCSKLDQWGIVFDHATANGIYLHFKMQETEIDDNRVGHDGHGGNVPVSLDGGKLGTERKLYCRELISRFGHELALNWNIGEENTQSTEEIQAMSQYIHDMDPYDHHIVIHTFPDWQNRVYRPLLGDASVLTGASLQNGWNEAHRRTRQWVRESRRAGRPWVCANDEQGPADLGVPPDPGYQGNDGIARMGSGKSYDLNDIRKNTLWGTLMAGGAGVEYYFGYRLPQNDLQCEDYRSRDRSWDYCRIALDFFRDQKVPFWKMHCADNLVGNKRGDNSKYCFAQIDNTYLVYLPDGGTSNLDLSDARGEFAVSWFDPRNGGEPMDGSVTSITGGSEVPLGQPPNNPREDWLVICRK